MPAKAVRDEFVKCSVAVFMVDDTTMLENAQLKTVHKIDSEQLTATSTVQVGKLPILKNLVKLKVEEYRGKEKLLVWVNELMWWHKQQKSKRNTQSPSQKHDPLNAAEWQI